MNDGTLSNYPADQAAFDSLGVSSANVSYQYSLLAGGTGYCITATVGSVSYFFNSTTASTPTNGSCIGHGSNGQSPITNLVLNPSLETNGSWWVANWATGGSGNLTRMTNGGVSGNGYMRGTWTTTSTGGNGGVYYNHPTTGQIAEGVTYTASASVRPSKNQRMQLTIYWINSAGNAVSTTGGEQVVVSAGSWTRLTASGVAPAGTVRYFVVPFSTSGTGFSQWAAGDTVDADAFMFTEGSNVYNYADGSTANWLWNGTVHNASSTGSPV